MFVKRSRYNSLVKEMEGLMLEVEGLRSELKIALDKKEKYVKQIDTLYSEAKINAESKSRLADEVKSLQEVLREFNSGHQDDIAKNFVIQEFVEPSPVDADDRALYVSRIAGYFNGGLRDYLNYMLAEFRAQLCRFPLTEREADFYRASINICHLLIGWGDEQIREHQANARGDEATQDAFEQPDEDFDSIEAVENIKRSVNN